MLKRESLLPIAPVVCRLTMRAIAVWLKDTPVGSPRQCADFVGQSSLGQRASPRGGLEPPNPSCRKSWKEDSPRFSSSGSCVFLTALGYHFEIDAGKTNKLGDT